MRVVTAEIYRAIFACGGMAERSARRVTVLRHAPGPQGFKTTGSDADAEIQEWAIADEVVARKVEACGSRMFWLRDDLAEIAANWLDAEHAGMCRVRDKVLESCARDRERRANAPPVDMSYMSDAMLRSVVNHSSRTGRLWDMNSRGDEERARIAMLMDHMGRDRA